MKLILLVIKTARTSISSPAGQFSKVMTYLIPGLEFAPAEYK